MATDVDVNCRDVVKGAFSKGNGSAGFCPRVPRLDQWVNRSFRAVERAADWLMGSAGPIFVTLCIVLVSIGAWTFFLLFLPSAFPPRSPSLSISFLIFPLALLTCLSIMHTIAWFYYTACRTPPGFVASFALESCRLAGDDIAAIDARWRQYAAEARGRSRWVDDGTIPRERLPQMRSEGRDGRIGEAGDDNDDDHWPRVKMCFKCPQIPLWKALAYLPPELREVERNKRTKAGVEGEQAVSSAAMTGLLHEEAGSSLRSRAASPRADDEDDTEEDEREKLIPSSSSSPSVTKRNRFLHLTAAEEDSLLLPLRRSILTWLPPSQAYTLVPPPKPERTHHCSVCKICVIKYDHHCPWLNQCVGLYNERHFLMFLFSLTLGMAIVLACGTREFIAAAKLLRAYDATPRLLVSFGGTNVVPRGFVLITYILCAVMGFALCVMGVSHLLMLGKGETNVEASDRSSLYEGLAKRRGVKFANVYSMGNKWENWRNWGSVALPRTERGGARRRRGGGSSTATGVGRLATLRAWLPVLLPVRRETTWSDGWHWPKRKGLGGVHAGIAEEEELTDEEVERDEQEQPGANEMSRPGPPTPAEGSHQPEMRGRAAAERQ